MTDGDPRKCNGKAALAPGNTDIFVQLVLSFALGISAFIAFCVSPQDTLCCFGRAHTMISLDPSPTMENTLRSKKATQES
jgi:hypothetical protein